MSSYIRVGKPPKRDKNGKPDWFQTDDDRDYTARTNFLGSTTIKGWFRKPKKRSQIF